MRLPFVLVLLAACADPWAERAAELARREAAWRAGEAGAREALLALEPFHEAGDARPEGAPWWEEAGGEPAATGGVDERAADAPEARLLATGPDAAAALEPYVRRGRVEEAARRLGDPGRAAELRRADALLREARSALLARRLHDAAEGLAEGRRIERALGIGEESLPGAELRRDLAAAWSREGRGHLRRGRLAAAFEAFSAAASLDPADAGAPAGIAAIERRVRRRLEAAPPCAELRELRAAVRAGSRIARRVDARFAGCEGPNESVIPPW